ncbi:hypothetical protein [Methanosarcina horonobensis]|nr:hypothetical protein [Methanosarcina horonobensis]
MDANIWLSTADRNEALLLHDTGNIQMSGTEELINEIRELLGLQNRKDRPMESRSVKPSSSGSLPDVHTAKLEAKVQLPDSGSSTGGFMKGLGSRFKLR